MRRCGNNMLSKWKIALISALVILAALLLLFLLRSNAPEPAKAPEIPAEAPLPAGVTFIDRFATLDAARWHVSDRSRDGWHVESELRPTQVATGPEGLRLTMDTNADGAGARYRSGEVQSIESFRYGYFEARMRVPRGAGVITGFFTYVGADGGDRPQEIDIEILGRSTREMALTYHVGGRGVEEIVRLPFDAAEGFHSYAFEWTADAIRWYVDNELVHEVRGARVERMSRSQKLIVNLWGTEALYRWAGRIDPVEAPWRLEVACMAQAERYMGRMLC